MSEQINFVNESNTREDDVPHIVSENTLVRHDSTGEQFSAELECLTEENPIINNDHILDERHENEDVSCFSEDDTFDVEYTGSVEQAVKHVIIDSDSDEELSSVFRIELADHTYDARSPSKRYPKGNDETTQFPGLEDYFSGSKNVIRSTTDNRSLVPSQVNRTVSYSNNGMPQLQIRPAAGITASLRTRNEFTPPVIQPNSFLRSPNAIPKRPSGQLHTTMAQSHLPQKMSNRGLPSGLSGNSSFNEPPSPQHAIKESQRLILSDGRRPMKTSLVPDSNRILTHPSNAPMLTLGRGPRQVPRGRGGSTAVVSARREDLGDEDDDDTLTPDQGDGVSSGHSPLKQVHFAENNSFGSSINTSVSGARTNRPPPPHRTGNYSPPKSNVIPPHRILPVNGGANAPTLVRHIPRTSHGYLLATNSSAASANDMHDMPDNFIDQGPEKPVSLKDAPLPPDIAEMAAELYTGPVPVPASDSSDKNEMKAKIQAIMNGLKQQDQHYDEPSPKGKARGNQRNRSSVSTSSSNFGGASPRRITSPPQRRDGMRDPRSFMRPPGSSPVRTNMDFNSQLMAPLTPSVVFSTARSTWLSSQESANLVRREAVKPARRASTKEATKKTVVSDNSSGDESGNIGDDDDHWEAGCICGMDHTTERMVECEKCKVWQHSECLAMNDDEFDRVEKDIDHFFCEKCQPKELRFTRMEARSLQDRYLKEVARIKQAAKKPKRSVEHDSAKSNASGSKIKLRVKEAKKSNCSVDAEKLLRAVPESTLNQDAPSEPKCSMLVVVKDINGLVTDKTFLRDDLVCELLGWICLPNECNVKTDGSTRCFLYDGLPKTGGKSNSNICLDLRKLSKDIEIRRSCRPNCIIKHSLQNNKLRLFLVATEDIDNCTELVLPFDAGTRPNAKLAKLCACSKDDAKCLFEISLSDIPLGHLKSSNRNVTSNALNEVPVSSEGLLPAGSVSSKQIKNAVKEEKSEEESLSVAIMPQEADAMTPVGKRGRPSKRHSEETSVKEEVIPTTRSNTRTKSTARTVVPSTPSSTIDKTGSIREERKVAQVEKLFAKHDTVTKERKEGSKRDTVGGNSNVRARTTISSRKRKGEELRVSSPVGSSQTPVGRTKDLLRRHAADVAADLPSGKKRATNDVSRLVDKGLKDLAYLKDFKYRALKGVPSYFSLPTDIMDSIKPSVQIQAEQKVEVPKTPNLPEEHKTDVVPESISNKGKRLTIDEYRKRKSVGSQGDLSPMTVSRSSPRKRGFIPAMDDLQAEDSPLSSIPLIALPAGSPKKGSATLPQPTIDELKRQVLDKDAVSPSCSSRILSPKSGDLPHEEYSPSMSLADRLKIEWGFNNNEQSADYSTINRNHRLSLPPSPCHRCWVPFANGEVHVAVDGTSWHQECFRCAQCFSLLGDDLYFNEGGRFYCQHDFQVLFAPFCHKCDEIIIGQVIHALNIFFHPHCIQCEVCHNDLSQGLWYADAKMVCMDCKELFSKEPEYYCAKCKHVIAKDDLLTFQSDFYHADHWNCTDCGKTLSADARTLREQLYCPRCFDLHCNSCAACRKVIDPEQERSVLAMGKHWHIHHFCCVSCGKSFMGEEHYERNGKPYCAEDYSTLFGDFCHICQTTLEGTSVRLFGKGWCRSCYSCTTCNSPLNYKDKVFELDMRPMCKHCFKNKNFQKVLEEKEKLKKEEKKNK